MSVLLNLFGVNQAMYFEQVLRATEIKPVENPSEYQNIEDLKAKTGFLRSFNQSKVTIHERIEVDLNSRDNVRRAWEYVDKKLIIATLASVVVTMVSLVTGSVLFEKEGKTLKTMAVFVTGVVSTIFAFLAFMASDIVKRERRELGSLPDVIFTIRKTIFNEGSDAINDVSLRFPKYLPRLPEYFTLQEQEVLFEAWTRPESPTGQDIQALHQTLKNLSMVLSEGTPYHEVVSWYLNLKDSDSSYIAECFANDRFNFHYVVTTKLEKHFAANYRCFDKLFRQFPTSDFLIDFLITLRTRFLQSHPILLHQMVWKAMVDIWPAHLGESSSEFDVDPRSFDHFDQGIYFKNLLMRVFAAEGAPQGYVEWLRQQINPLDTPLKAILLEALPKETA